MSAIADKMKGIDVGGGSVGSDVLSHSFIPAVSFDLTFR